MRGLVPQSTTNQSRTSAAITIVITLSTMTITAYLPVLLTLSADDDGESAGGSGVTGVTIGVGDNAGGVADEHISAAAPPDLAMAKPPFEPVVCMGWRCR